MPLRTFQGPTTAGHREPRDQAQGPDYPRGAPELPKQYYHSDGHLKELKEQLNDLLEKEFILPSNLPIRSPVFLVGKKDGSWRLFISFCASNGITAENEYPNQGSTA